MMMLRTRKQTYHVSDRTHIMGILNVTPDSFSDGGQFSRVNQAVEHAIKLQHEGADIIDIGGESTRPGHEPLSVEEELERILPVIEEVNEKVNIPISVDTFKAETAYRAVRAGADIINDIWGAKKDPEIARVAAEQQVPIILMHNRTNMNYESLIDDMRKDLEESIDIALKAGVPKKNIILDPGVGFAKTSEDNFVVMNQLEKFSDLGFPILLATSRKSFIGKLLDIPPEERDNATGATTCLGIIKGAHMVRVHNVKLHLELAKMMDAMLKGEGALG